MTDTGQAARRSAIYLLDQILGEGRLMSELLASGALDRLEPQDRARAQRLAMETLRGLERADRLLQKHLRKYPPLTVRNALRVGTVELCQGEAAHGVVNSMVAIVSRHKRHGALKGLVNAVLRKIADQGPDAWGALRVPRLPKWLRNPLVAAWGPEAVMAMEQAHFAGAPVDLSLSRDDDALVTALGGTRLPTGSVRLGDAGQISTLPGYEDGAWWVQDAAAAIPVMCLDPQPGEKIIDLCAAPGGKTLQLAAAGADVVAVDTSEPRMARVRENLARTGLTADLRVDDALNQTGQYDAVLLDAPCSATGTIRRHPDLPFAKDGSDFMALFDLQSQLLDHAWGLVKPGGRLVYCTCSLLPDEGEVQVEEALPRLPGAQIDRAALDRPGIDPAWITAEGGLRLRPDYWADLGGMDGFYIAVLRKET
ncbi:RsmB/NOP family class I SAM-dependent RNA methyltransferase [Aestuariivita boseongensis]|uniref:RsmB/NOP family class I SAM-dependent RNA methyltransferase n=1 Tax=Aestuariivita boseongensis TaxID=1470562 RepID=UPI0006815ACF|nr:RsmB/NOP family class I SAM-dependent RNA methyltransferase [Aestuariivita boseongensis]